MQLDQVLTKPQLNAFMLEAVDLAEKQMAAKNSPFLAFQEKYRHNPRGFVHDCIEFRSDGPTAYQDDILNHLGTERRVAVRGPHGIGKTALASWIVLWGILTVDDCKAITTASAWRQLTKYLWPEIHKWVGRLRWDKIGREPLTRDELLTLSIKRSPTCEAFAVASNKADLIEGAHAQRVVYIYDESKAVPDDTFDATEGAFSGAGEDTDAEGYALAISTPGEPIGRFYDIHVRKTGYEEWWVRHVTLEEAIAAGRISREWAENRKRQWGEKSAIYQNRVVGEFASSDEDGVIPLAWVELANERWRQWEDAGKPLDGPMTVVGVDVARYGDDKTIFALRYGNIITELRKHSKMDTMETTGLVTGVLQKGGKAVVDVIGIGAGVVDRLRELKMQVEPFTASAKTGLRDKSGEMGFVDVRSAAWWNLREILDPSGSEEIALPPDDELTGDLVAPKWQSMSGGRIKVESKKEIRKRLKRSTDCADAVIQAFWKQYSGWARGPSR